MNISLSTIVRGRTCGKPFLLLSILVLLFCFSLFSSATAAEKKKTAEPDKAGSQYEEKWGIRPLGIQLSAGGYMLDFRYHVIDAEKAAPLFSRQINPYLIDQASGQRFSVSETQRFGALRQTRKPSPDKNYYMIFGNPAQRVKKGNTVTVVIGDLTIKDLAVQ